MDYKHSSHSTFDLKYHIVFCTKYRYRILVGETAVRVREIIRETCATNYVDIVYVDIVSGNVTPDHIHMLISMPPTIQVSTIYQRQANYSKNLNN